MRLGSRNPVRDLGLALALASVSTAAHAASAVEVETGATIVLTTPVARFTFDAGGHTTAALRRGDGWVGLDDGVVTRGDRLLLGEKPLAPASFDTAAARLSETFGPLGATGKAVTVVGRAVLRDAVIEKTVTLECYDELPHLLVVRLTVTNVGARPVIVDRLVLQSRRLSAAGLVPSLAPHDLWHFAGAANRWAEDDVVHLAPGFARDNPLAVSTGEAGGGVPVAAFWSGLGATAIGLLEPRAIPASLPVQVTVDGRVEAELVLGSRFTFVPGRSYEAPRSFVSATAGDFYAPLRLWSIALTRLGWPLTRPTAEAYAPTWCGWGYELDVTPAQMLGTLPKLKALGLHWATLDDRWFDRYGDWAPRPDTFPGDSLKQMIAAFHREGVLVQLWWLPLGVAGEAQVLREHPDWAILDEQGQRATMARGLVPLCPALPEVQAYVRALTERFVREWDVDGHKLDVVYSVPRCFNALHHHRSPDESVEALGDVYRLIFETTRALKPKAVTQICPCGTPPSVAWLPFLDQPVTADPVNATQVRRRIKMYKALLGPDAPVYGDHVELTRIERASGKLLCRGRDFASTVGLGGVPGTRFVWPGEDVSLKLDALESLLLTPEKEAHWKRWLGLYDRLQLARGTYRDLYVTGYDVPEGHVIAKDGRLYYAFFAPDEAQPWTGTLELRGLPPAGGLFRVRDYVNERDLGLVEAANPRLEATIDGALLLEVSPPQPLGSGLPLPRAAQGTPLRPRRHER